LIASVFGTLEVPIVEGQSEPVLGAALHDAYAAWVVRRGPELRRLRGAAEAAAAQGVGYAAAARAGRDPVSLLPFDPAEGVPLLAVGSVGGLGGERLRAGVVAGGNSLTASCGSGTVTVRHRSVEACIPESWLNEYVLSTLVARVSPGGTVAGVTSPKRALASLLPEYSAASSVTGVNRATLEGLIGCWNGYRGPESLAVLTGQEEEQGYAFWYEGWGAPWEWTMMMLDLMVTYWSFISLPAEEVHGKWVDPFSGTGRCIADRDAGGAILDVGDNQSLAEFARDLLSGKEAKTRDLKFVNRCKLTVHFKSYDTRSEVARTREGSASFAVEGCARKATGACGDGFKFGSGNGLPWDDFEANFDSITFAYRSNTAYSVKLFETGYPGFPIEWNDVAGIGGGFGLTLRPTYAGFGGFLADRLLFDARMCLDYFSASGDKAVLDSGYRFARFAVAPMVQLGQIAVHEIGHVFVGSGHCIHGCCFDYAAGVWACGVRGALGLPHGAFDDTGEDDARSDLGDVGGVNCGSGASATCEVSAYGVQGSGARFCADTPDVMGCEHPTDPSDDPEPYRGVYTERRRVCADIGAGGVSGPHRVVPKDVPEVVIDTLRELLEAESLVGELLVPERLGLLPDGDDGVIRPGEP